MSFLFFFNDTATTEIYTLSLHDALPISIQSHIRRSDRSWHAMPLRGQIGRRLRSSLFPVAIFQPSDWERALDRKSTRLNSSHANISYAVFCLKKKKKREISKITHIATTS